MPNPSGQWSILRRAFLALAVGLVFAASAQASHFRGASLTWKKLATPANSIEVTVTESWRTGASGGQTWNWGDSTTFNTGAATVIATGSDVTGDFTIIRKVLTHTYSGLGPWTISAGSSARIGPPLTNANQSSWALQAIVNMNGGNQGSPVISSPILLQMIQGGLNTVPLSFADVDGDNVTFRMATSAESGIPTLAGAGGKNLAVSAGGVLTWDTSSTVVGQVYAVQVIANDNHGGTGTTKVFFDFMIQIVDGTLNRPPVASGNSGPFTAAIGVPFANTITGTDPDGGVLTVSNLGLPVGATMSPASGTTAGQPLAAVFNWTPTIADAGSSVGVTIVFTDPKGLQASKSFSISVPANQPPVANAGQDFSVFDVDANHIPTVVTLNGAGSYDPEGLALTYAWTQLSGPVVALVNANSATPRFNAPNVTGAPLDLLFQLTVSDGNSSRSANVFVSVKNLNFAPRAVAAVVPSANEDTAVVLDGSSSSDLDGDSLTYTWTQTSGSPVVLANNGTNSPLLTFSHIISSPHSVAGETLEFTLTVSDGIASNVSAPARVFIRNVNNAPEADAGNDATYPDTAVGILIDGHAHDLDGDNLSYTWVQIAGPTVVLANPRDQETTFNAPSVSPAQGSVTLTFKLIATDAIDANDAAALTSSDTVDILVRHANRAPIADAGADKTVPEQSTVVLDGSGSYDPDNDSITYAWVQTSGSAVTLSGATSVSPSFTAPNVGPAGETLTFALTVKDVPNAAFAGSALTSAPKSVSVVVKYVNQLPTIAVVSPQTVNEASVATVPATASDPDGNTLTYTWTQLSGPTVTLNLTNPAAPTFTTPFVPFGGGSVVLKATVDDGFGGTASAQATVNIANVNNPPVADAGVNQSVNEATAVSLNGLTSSDLDGEALTYAWVQTAGPAVTLAGAATATPSFTAPVVTAGGDPAANVTLTFKLTVTDIAGDSTSDFVDVKVANVDHAPIANAGGSQNVGEAVTATLNASASSDPDGDALTFAWTQVSGTPVVLAGANTATPSFTAPFVGTAGASLVFKVTVRDPFGGVGTDLVTIGVFNTNTPPSVSQAKASTAVLWPPNHQMVQISILGVLDPENNATITITSVWQDEPTNGLGDGDTAVDAIIQGSTVLVRSERSGTGNGRVYHIHFTASDFEGSASGVVTVSVPHDKKDTAVDGGELFDSTK